MCKTGNQWSVSRLQSLYDADTLEPESELVERLTGKLPEAASADRGYRGRKSVLGVQIQRAESILLPIVFMCLFACNSSNKYQAGKPIQVGEGQMNTVFSYYNTSPESPDGSKIAYTKFLDNPKNDRTEKVAAEIWVCDSDLSMHRRVIAINKIEVHNGARVQWLDNHSFAYQDDSIRAIDLDGRPIMKPVGGISGPKIGHETFNGRFLYSGYDNVTGLSTIYEYDVFNQKTEILADASDFKEALELFADTNLTTVSKFWILHLQYSPCGGKIAFRLDIGPKNPKWTPRTPYYRHLVVMDRDGNEIEFFGPKPMHFSWFDDDHIQGHDSHVDDGLPNDKSGRVWDFERNEIETLSGPGNHFAASPDKQIIASESWYDENPVILSLFRRGECKAFWQDTVSTDSHTTWTLANHANPSFSRDGKRVYYNKCVAPGKVYAFMALIPDR